MGWFSNPKCPQCGRETTPTGYSFPYPQYRCRPCIKVNTEIKDLRNRVKELESR